MDLAQNITNAREVGRTGKRVGGAPFIAAAVAVAAILAMSWIVGLRGGLGSAPTSDPFVQPAAIEFRLGEHGASVSGADPFIQPAAIEFRRGEHGASVAGADPFIQPAAIEFRRGEHEGVAR